MSAKVAKAIRQTRRILAEKTWVPQFPQTVLDEICATIAVPMRIRAQVWHVFDDLLDEKLGSWCDRQTDVGAVLGMTLEALIAELCKPEIATQDQP